MREKSNKIACFAIISYKTAVR